MSMDDKKIRKILIEYLKTTVSEIRVYQEKSIGSSVCDIMTVTDCLTGYEIKSDRDNYQRLESQINAYNRFFDKNYIVVGANHRNSVSKKVPEEWGILVVEETGINVIRNAKRNKYCGTHHNQLKILWKIELKNILTKFDLPLYTYKSKNYIVDSIIEALDTEQIKNSVVYELMHRDYSLFDAKDHTIYSSNADSSSLSICSSLPTTEIIDTLSEQDLSEITLDQWIALYRQAKDIQENKDIKFENKPVERKAHAISYKDIEVYPGVPWVSKKIINEFTYYLRTGKKWELREEKGSARFREVNYEPITGYWYVERKLYKYDSTIDRTRTEHIYGLPYYNALYILEATLNLREIKRYDDYNQYNEQETIEVLEKQDKIIELFKSWIWEDEDRRWEIEEAYNNLFSTFKSHKYDGSMLKFPEMNKDVCLYPYQKDAVQKIITEKNTLLAFDVGAGKTFIMITAAMKLRQEGKARKNMFVVPNNIVGQWELIFKSIYPNAKILTIEPKSFKPEMRQKILKQIKDGDYDGIIIAYSCFEMIPLSCNFLVANMNNKIGKIQEAISRISYESGSRFALEREIQYIRKTSAALIDSAASTVSEITFEQLEINTLFVDEAHNFKNIPIRTNLKNLVGINTKGSAKCNEMLQKVRCVQNSNNGRGVVFATGTPLCNSISDAYAMQMYLQYDEIKNSHLERFDNWVKTFAKPERVCEIDVDTSKFRFVNRFSKFYNLPELSKMFSDIAIFHAMDGDDGLPKLDGYNEVVIAKNGYLQKYMDELCERTEKIRKKQVDRSVDNMLKVSTDGRKAALDLRLVGTEQPYNQYSKIYQCVQNIMRIYKESSDFVQIVFCDYSTPKGDKFNVYSEIQKKLQEEGIPSKEIAFIHSFHTEARKVELFKKVNSGVVRVLIGSTFKLGIGANVQERLKAVHHLDVPWRPADMVQREGRILRKGNQNEYVQIYRYICEGSFDAYSWQILETKQRFISEFLSGSSYQRTASDLEENVLTYAQVKALAISEPLMKDLAEKQNELRRINILSSSHSSNIEKTKMRLVEIKNQLDTLDKRYEISVENLKHLTSVSEKEYSAVYSENKNIISVDIVSKEHVLSEEVYFLDFRVVLPEEQNSEKPFIFLERLDSKYLVHMGKSANGNARRIINFLKKFDNVLTQILENKNNLLSEEEQCKKAIQESNPFENERERLKAEIGNLEFEIQRRIS